MCIRLQLSIDYTMKVIFPPRKKGTNTTFRVGVYFLSDCFHYALLDINHEISTGKVKDIAALTTMLTQQYRQRLSQTIFVSALPNHLVWRQNIHVPETLNQYALEQHIYHILEHELPSDGQAVWFDYSYQQANLELYVVKQHHAEQELAKYSPLSLNILDTLPRVLLRAFRYLSGKRGEENVLYCFYTENPMFILDSSYKTEVFYAYEDFATSWHKAQDYFSRRFAKVVVFNATEQDEGALTSCETAELQQLPKMSQGQFIALGCVLWGLDV